MARLELTLLAGFAAHVAGRLFHVPGRKARIPLAPLTPRPGQVHPHEHPPALLRGEPDGGQAADSLRHALGANRGVVWGTHPTAPLDDRYTVALRPGAAAPSERERRRAAGMARRGIPV
jgi:hypothetical protein